MTYTTLVLYYSSATVLSINQRTTATQYILHMHHKINSTHAFKPSISSIWQQGRNTGTILVLIQR